MSKIFYKLYQPTGLFNQVMSLEVAVGLQHRYQKELVIHNINNLPSHREDGQGIPIYSANYSFNDRKGLLDTDVFPSVKNLLTWSGKEKTVFIDHTLETPPEPSLIVEDMLYVYSSDKEEYQKDEDFFSEGRSKLPASLDSNIFIKRTLGYYSRFFLNRDRGLDASISSVRFNQSYYDLAHQIAASLGDFNGAHFRLTDHKGFFDPTTNDLDAGIQTLEGNLPVVLCTDQANSPVIKGSDHKYVILDEYILNNFYNEFSQLEYREEVSFGALNNLVMHYSKDFIGSPGSTYSGYIQRALNQNQGTSWKTFCEKEHMSTGPYSWNGHDKDTATKQWWREWKESKVQK